VARKGVGIACEGPEPTASGVRGQAALKDLPEIALKKIGDNQSSLGEKIGGWQVTKGLGVFGTD
jgi:hypothetical protein